MKYCQTVGVQLQLSLVIGFSDFKGKRRVKGRARPVSERASRRRELVILDMNAG